MSLNNKTKVVVYFYIDILFIFQLLQLHKKLNLEKRYRFITMCNLLL